MYVSKKRTVLNLIFLKEQISKWLFKIMKQGAQTSETINSK